MTSIYSDCRGDLHVLKSLPFDPQEILISSSHARVLRGLHYSPYKKFVYVIKGSIRDFWYQPSSGASFEGVVRAGNAILVPENAMHGFYSIEQSDLIYFLEKKFLPENDIGYFWNSPGLPFTFDFNHGNLIISDKDRTLPFYQNADFVVLGGSGFLGSYMVKVLREQGYSFFQCNARLNDFVAIRQVLKQTKAKYVICAAGISGRPTTAWCDANERETFIVNYLCLLNLMELTHELGLHLTIFGSGMVYSANASNEPYDESAPANNFNAGVYAKYRCELESHLKLYPKVLCLRIMYPVTADGHPKCFLTKMKQRANSVHNMSVPMTVVPNLFPVIPRLAVGTVCGPLNFVNGNINLSEFLEIFSIDYTCVKNLNGINLSVKKLSEVCQTEIVAPKKALARIKNEMEKMAAAGFLNSQ